MRIGKIEFLWKDDASNTGNCPSLSRVSLDGRDGYLINGIPVDEAVRVTVPHAGGGEGAVWVPANVVDRIRDLG